MDCSMWSFIFYLILTYGIYKTVDFLLRLPKLGSPQSRHVFITGCDTGFGHDIALRLDKLGVNVFAGCLTEEGRQILKQKASGRLFTILINVEDHQSVVKALKCVKDNLPEGKGLWAVLNNAGIVRSRGPVDWHSKSEYDQVLKVNLTGLIDVTHTFLPLVKQAKGRIVNVSSVTARFAVTGFAPYVVSKYGVEAFSDILRRDMMGFGIGVHIIEPGAFRTPITSLESTRSGYTQSWSTLSPELKEQYGQDFLDKVLENAAKRSSKIRSPKVHLVVDAMEHALLGKYPRARYLVGNDAKYFWWLMQCLPEWLSDTVYQKLSDTLGYPRIVGTQNH